MIGRPEVCAGSEDSESEDPDVSRDPQLPRNAPSHSTQIRDADRRIMHLELALTEATNTIARLRSEHRLMTAQMKTNSDQLDQLQSENLNLQLCNSKQKKEARRVFNQKEDLRKETYDFKRKADNQDGEIANLKAIILQLKSERDTMSGDLLEAQVLSLQGGHPGNHTRETWPIITRAQLGEPQSQQHLQAPEKNHQGVSSKSKRKVTVIGSSMVRGLGCHLYDLDPSAETCVFVNPGCKLEDVSKRIHNFCRKKKPNVIALHLGSNNMMSDDLHTCIRKHEVLMEEVYRHSPHATVILSGLTPRLDCHDQDTVNNKIENFNEYLRYISAKSNGTVSFVDNWDQFSSDFLRKDGLHLTKNGSTWMAATLK